MKKLFPALLTAVCLITCDDGSNTSSNKIPATDTGNSPSPRFVFLFDTVGNDSAWLLKTKRVKYDSLKTFYFPIPDDSLAYATEDEGVVYIRINMQEADTGITYLDRKPHSDTNQYFKNFRGRIAVESRHSN